MKKIVSLFFVMLLVFSGCQMEPKENKEELKNQNGPSDQVIAELKQYNGTYTGSVYISGYGSTSTAISIVDGVFSISLTSVYYCLAQKETASYYEQYNSQMTALQSQYQLGLISREEYEKAAEEYQKKLDDNVAPIAAKYGASIFTTFVQKDASGYYATVKGQRANMTFGATGITYEDPISGMMIRF